MIFALIYGVVALIEAILMLLVSLLRYWWVILIVFFSILIMAKLASGSPNDTTTSPKEKTEGERERYWKAHPGEKRELLAQREKMRHGLYAPGISNSEREYLRQQLKEINNKLWNDQ